jgi:hypothetical protein
MEAVDQLFGVKKVEIKQKTLEALRLLRQADRACNKVCEYFDDLTKCWRSSKSEVGYSAVWLLNTLYEDLSDSVVGRLDMYRTKVLLYRTIVLMARPTKVRR